MSDLKLCQGNKCHTYHTKDRIRGSQGDKHYETRRRSQFYYGQDNFCSLNCQNDWFRKFGNNAIDHFGRLHEPKRQDASGAWYKDYKWVRQDSNRTVYNHYFVNDLLGDKIPISQAQYEDRNYTAPFFSSATKD